MEPRNFTPLDRLIIGLDRVLGAAFGRPAHASRANPAGGLSEAGRLTPEERSHAAGLMRVNHAGEIAAQALYQAHAFWARDHRTRQAMEQAAQEESDHLAWCEQRLAALGSRPSLLRPFWYAGSFAIGSVASLLGDRWGLGFVAETEQQVVRHLESHLGMLPAADLPSREIVRQMRDDESRHAAQAVRNGAVELPEPVRSLMSLAARVMTTTAYRI
ncbi:MAG: 2-polyprenyl-3-methyl-6-methoxy-1,4-benzoquinone monooxygenase [Gammaproteobacteria bacterium]|nr:2-polyprenyl-3-methyl-6-methoxy-1,4-benzoquinone monooxygenase [Gammaproteobacteria bacterium]